MADVKFNSVTKRFGDFTAVDKFDLSVQDKEFIVLVGPSGCGKTTTLRMLAGLDEITEGDIKINDRVINHVPPKNRDIAMVFQSYALYPHYSVFENLAFGLRTRGKSTKESVTLSSLMFSFYFALMLGFWLFTFLLDFFIPGIGLLVFGAGILGGIAVWLAFGEIRRDIHKFVTGNASNFLDVMKDYVKREREIEQKVKRTAKLLGIEQQLWKKPRQLSGGQRQRVALGRVIIRNPQVFLLDEPLSNLDAKLRVQMRAELQRLQNRLQVTTIYVTHDQIEAMTLADRIVIMNEGVIQQVGTPDEVYSRPNNLFVADFIGSPSMNFIEGKIEGQNFVCEAFTYPIPNRYQSQLKTYSDDKVILGIRPEHIILSPTVESNKLSGKVGVLEPIGSDTYVHLDFTEETSIVVTVEGDFDLDLDQEVSVEFNEKFIHFFDTQTTQRIK